MAGTTVLGRLTWQSATVTEARRETSSAVTLALDVPGWGSPDAVAAAGTAGHRAGQHVDVRLTAEDGYAAQRSYSIASAPGDPLEITVQRVPGGEVSEWLAGIAAPGDTMEIRGPIGGYFVWPPPRRLVGPDGLPLPRAGGEAPALLVGGGSGVVPLMSMIRARASAASRTPFRLIYSVRTPEDALYADELRRRIRDDQGLDVAYAYTRSAPEGWPGKVGRIDAARLTAAGWPAELEPDVYVCGPTGFVETVADLLVDAGHDAGRVRTERFGPTGG